MLSALVLAASSSVGVPSSAAATGSPATLVYAFRSQSVRADRSDKAYGVDKMDPGGGGTFLFHNVNQHYIAAPPDESPQRSGTIAVTIVRRQADGALVVRVVQKPSPDGRAAPFDCVVFADTSLICDPQRTLAPESEALLRLLSPGFAAPAQSGTNGWKVARSDGSGSLQFTAKSAARGGMVIGETGILTGAQAWTTDVAATIDYDTARELPTAVRQSTVARRHRGAVDEAVSTDTTISLIEDAIPTRSTIP